MTEWVHVQIQIDCESARRTGSTLSISILVCIWISIFFHSSAVAMHARTLFVAHITNLFVHITGQLVPITE